VRVAVIGAGAVGARAARQLVSSPEVEAVCVHDVDPGRVDDVVRGIADPRCTPGDLDRVDVGIVAVPAGDHRDHAEQLLDRGAAVVSVSDSITDVRALLALDDEARIRGLPVVVGAGFAPGLTDVLARHASTAFDSVEEIHVAKVGTGGPACAKQHHRALVGEAVDWRDGSWFTRRAGSGRELCWFPDPVGGQDCYRAGAPDALLLAPAFAGVRRVTARVGANRRDRLTARLPMLRPPHPEGGVGAVRVEVRGRRGSAADVTVYGAMDRPAVASGAVAALAAEWAGAGRLEPGAGGLAAPGLETVPFLAELARRGVKAAVFQGTAS
jgi:hypothetical protein